MRKGDNNMGVVVISGSFVSSHPYEKFAREIYRDLVRNNFNYYTGTIGTIDIINHDAQIQTSYYESGETKIYLGDSIKRYIEENKNIKTKRETIEGFLLHRKLKYCKPGELIYIADTSTVVGYEVTTYGGYREVTLKPVEMEDIKEWLSVKENIRKENEGMKGYTLFQLYAGEPQDSCNAQIAPFLRTMNLNDEFYTQKKTLKEIEDVVKDYIIYNQETFFAVKYDMSKVYILEPTVKLQKNKAESTETRKCRKAYPVYYVGCAIC